MPRSARANAARPRSSTQPARSCPSRRSVRGPRRRSARSRARNVASPTNTPSTGAADCRRAAVFTTSPATIPSPDCGSAPTRDQRLTRVDPDRTWRSPPRSPTASWIARPARTARSASSSCATGAPNTAITASPMNFSTVPPKLSNTWRRVAWNGASVPRTSSTSSCSLRLVNPTRSANSTETTLRSSIRSGAIRRRRIPSRTSHPRCSRAHTPRIAPGKSGRAPRRPTSTITLRDEVRAGYAPERMS